MKVCRLALGDKYKEDVFELQNDTQRRYSDPNPIAQNMKEYEGMGFDDNNYSPIPWVSGLHCNTEIQDLHQHQNQQKKYI